MWKRWKAKEGIKISDIQAPALEPRLTLTLLPDKPVSRRNRIAKKILKSKNILKTGLWILFAGGVLFLSSILKAEELKVPSFINFQSVLADAGGVPLSDGLYNVSFRIRNAAGALLYEETQSLESVGGVVSAMIGSTEGIPEAAILPDTAKFLGVTVEGGGPETQMEIVSVPYAMVAAKAAAVFPQSIGTEAIRANAITKDLLAEDVLDDLAESLAAQNFPALFISKEQLQSVAGAAGVGVQTDFVYSRGGVVQTVLKDLDLAIHQRQVNLEGQGLQLNQRIEREVRLLQAVQLDLQGQVNNAATREYVDERLSHVATKEELVQANVNVDQAADISADLSRRVDLLESFPKVVAAGIVVGQPPSLSAGNNIANITQVLTPAGVICPVGIATRLNFQADVGNPVFVTVTATAVNWAVQEFRPFVVEATSTYITVCDSGLPFHAIVFR